MTYLKVYNPAGKKFYIKFNSYQEAENWKYKKQNVYGCWFHHKMRIPKTGILVENISNDLVPNKVSSLLEVENYINSEVKKTLDWHKIHPGHEKELIGNWQFN